MTDKGKVSVNKIKDSFTVGLKVAKAAVSNDEFGELDIAVAKATNTDEVTPKEKHMRTILAACARSQQETGFVIHCLQKRLQEKDWLIVLKALMVLHRLLREGPMRFADDIHKFQREHGPVHHLVNFRDARADQDVWDYSAWLRTYSLYLEERLECFRGLGLDVERCGPERSRSLIHGLETDRLLDVMPMLQALLQRTVGCKPEGAARHNKVVLHALHLVLKESKKVYAAVNDGVCNLIDLFFSMERVDAIKAYDSYKLAYKHTVDLRDLYDICKLLDIVGVESFPDLTLPPKDFLETMQQSIQDAPRAMAAPARSPAPAPASPAASPVVAPAASPAASPTAAPAAAAELWGGAGGGFGDDMFLAAVPSSAPPATAAAPWGGGGGFGDDMFLAAAPAATAAAVAAPRGFPPPAPAVAAQAEAPRNDGASLDLMGFDDSFGNALPAPGGAAGGLEASGFDDEDDDPFGGASGGGEAEGSGGKKALNQDTLAHLYDVGMKKRMQSQQAYGYGGMAVISPPQPGARSPMETGGGYGGMMQGGMQGGMGNGMQGGMGNGMGHRGEGPYAGGGGGFPSQAYYSPPRGSGGYAGVGMHGSPMAARSPPDPFATINDAVSPQKQQQPGAGAPMGAGGNPFLS